MPTKEGVNYIGNNFIEQETQNLKFCSKLTCLSFLLLPIICSEIAERAASYSRAETKTRTFVPLVRKKQDVIKANPFSNSDADDEDDNDFEVTAGEALFLYC